MIKVTRITIQNGNNNPSLFSKEINKEMADAKELSNYRLRVKDIAQRRYNKEHITVFFNYKEI